MSVTVIMPARNEGKYIAKALESLVNQSYQPTQIIVVLDRCTDDTECIVDEFCLKFDKIAKVAKNDTKYPRTFMKGYVVAETINIGLEHAKPLSDYVMIANADSIYSDGYLKEAIDIMKEYHECAIVGYSHYSTISGSGYVIRSAFLHKLGNRLKECAAEDTYVQLAAMNYGYSIRSIQYSKVSLLRERGEGTPWDRLKYAFSKGYSSYTLGYSLYYELARTLYWIAKGKFSHIAIIFGFFYGSISRAEKLDIANTMAAKEWQKRRIKSAFSY